MSPLCVCGTPDVVLTEVRPSHVYCPSGSADAILALINAGASVSADDKDGLTGECVGGAWTGEEGGEASHVSGEGVGGWARTGWRDEMRSMSG